MCVSPLKIRNRFSNTIHYRSELGGILTVPPNLYSRKEFIVVPCGKCVECRDKYLNSIYQRAYVESLSSYVYFITLTYDNEHIPCITLPNGKVVYYADYRHIQALFDRFRKNFDRDYRYLCVNEYGDNNNRPHFHLLLFVAKYDDDTIITPFNIERDLFDKFYTYFAVNVGTRKCPVYERLFTYRYKYLNGKLYSNFYLTYVDSAVTDSVAVSSEHSLNISKTIRYLISYVNKGSRFDDFVLSQLEELKDKVLVSKFKQILKCRVNYSKGFGNGFFHGKKIELPIISQRMSSLDLYYSNIVECIDSYDSFCDLYPDRVSSFSDFASNPSFYQYDCIDDFVKNASDSDVFNHFILYRFFPILFNYHYNLAFLGTRPYISYFYKYLHPLKYGKKLVSSFVVQESPTFLYIRKCVKQGLQSFTPFIPFVDFSGPNFYNLCDYYKIRCTTLSDFQDMLDNCGFVDYDDWLDSFLRFVSSKKLDKAKGNLLMMHTELIQRNCVSSAPIKDYYNFFFV